MGTSKSSSSESSSIMVSGKAPASGQPQVPAAAPQRLQVALPGGGGTLPEGAGAASPAEGCEGAASGVPLSPPRAASPGSSGAERFSLPPLGRLLGEVRRLLSQAGSAGFLNSAASISPPAEGRPRRPSFRRPTAPPAAWCMALSPCCTSAATSPALFGTPLSIAALKRLEKSLCRATSASRPPVVGSPRLARCRFNSRSLKTPRW